MCTYLMTNILCTLQRMVNTRYLFDKFLINILLYIHVKHLLHIHYTHQDIARNIRLITLQNLYDMNYKFHLNCMIYIQLHKIYKFGPLHKTLVNMQYKYLLELDIQYIIMIDIVCILLQLMRNQFHNFYRLLIHLDSRFGNYLNI